MKTIIHPVHPFIPVALAAVVLTGCATFRGMPAHGGGKRFDEEQRVVTASIRHASQQMNFSRLKKRKVAIEVTSLETSGTGQAFYPGLGTVNAYYDWYKEVNDFNMDQANIPATPNPGYIKDNESVRDNIRTTPNFEFNPSLKANNNITRQDVDYLTRVLEMRLRHDGFQVVPLNQAEVYLVVLVDALGTNLSRKDFLVAFDDDLKATCEMTYYAINPADQKLIFAAHAVASESAYMERNVRFTPIQYHTRNIGTFNERIAPLPTAAGAFAGGRDADAGVYVDPVKQKADELSQEASIAIDANDRAAAQKLINNIRKINPNHPDLPDLQQRLQEL
jgi:hypothetical protein